jgi:LPXTG-motif cell wall-anchored protein
MKKVVLTFLLFVTVCIGASSQGLYQGHGSSDGFFDEESDVLSYRSNTLVPGVNIPALPRIKTDQNQPAPIGSGLLVLTGLGLGYLIKKRNKE